MIATPATTKQYYFLSKINPLFTICLCRTCISISVAAFISKKLHQNNEQSIGFDVGKGSTYNVER